MELNEYQKLALRTAGDHGDEQHRLMYTALGLNGEAGEVAEIIKKALFHGHDLDKEMLLKELGDVMWYVAVLADTLGLSLDEVGSENIAKLRRRYPDGFSSERSRNRTEP